MTTGTSSSTSESLLRRVQEDDGEAWQRLAGLYTPTVYGWCRAAGLAEPDVLDVAQNVFLSVHKNIKGFRHSQQGDTFRGWLWRITRNEVALLYRRRAQQPRAAGGTAVQDALQRIPALFESDSAPSQQNDDNLIVHRALQLIHGEFEPQTWQAFLDTTVNDRSPKEVGIELAMTPKAVRQAKYRVLKRLREFLAED